MQKAYVECWKVQEEFKAMITTTSGAEQEEEELPRIENYKRKKL